MRCDEIVDSYEIHWTLRPQAVEQWAVVDTVASALGLKVTHIVLNRGETQSQPMLSQRSTSDFSAQRAQAESLTQQLATHGLTVTRTKIEAALSNRSLETLIHRAIECRDTWYFEQHVKVMLRAEDPLDTLIALSAKHHAHPSRNARRVFDDGGSERFFTQRLYGHTVANALAVFSDFEHALATAGAHILSTERECVLHDSNPSVDRGWLET